MIDNITEVNCPITGAKFTIVKEGNEENQILFNKWVEDLLQRANSGKSINLSIDCEGFHLGIIKNSLSCIQVGEIFDDSFFVQKDITNVPNIGSKPGFIVLAPISNENKEKISQIFNHPNTTLFTFDFTCDFSSMIESGIQINMSNVFDSQLASHSGGNFYICYMKIQSLSWFVNHAKDLDPLASKAISSKNFQKNNYFNVAAFLYKDSENPSQEIINKELLTMGASDIYMTGLAATYCIKNGLVGDVISKSKKKVDEFNQYVSKYGNILAPAISRQIAFFNFHRYEKYRQLTLNDTTEKDLISLLIIFQDMLSLIHAHDVFKRNYKGKMDPDQAERMYKVVTQKLEANRPRLVEMLNKYS